MIYDLYSQLMLVLIWILDYYYKTVEFWIKVNDSLMLYDLDMKKLYHGP